MAIVWFGWLDGRRWALVGEWLFGAERAKMNKKRINHI